MEELTCSKCNVPLISTKITLTYMNLDFYAELPACPHCGQVYISEEMVRSKIAEVEIQMEDK